MSKKRLFVVGIGPGDEEKITLNAMETLKESDVIAGYTLYCEIVKKYLPDKEFISTGMTGEEKRVEMALEKANEGFTVSLVCSGDAGVYGLAGLAFEIGEKFPDVEIQVIPGVTAAISGAALLGAPLIHDFAIISLSDRLTRQELIDKRLRLAAEADMVIVLYNPESKSRKGYLSHACDILLEVLPPDRMCGIARNIARDMENKDIMTLRELKDAQADMFCTVFIGNSSTKKIGDHLVTARGYKSE